MLNQRGINPNQMMRVAFEEPLAVLFLALADHSETWMPIWKDDLPFVGKFLCFLGSLLRNQNRWRTIHQFACPFVISGLVFGSVPVKPCWLTWVPHQKASVCPTNY